MKSNKKLVAVTMVDPSGVSTEIIIKSWKKTANTFFVIHDPDYIKKVANKLKTKVKIKRKDSLCSIHCLAVKPGV